MDKTLKKQLFSKQKELHKASTWMIILSEKNNAFVTLNDHKQNFRSVAPCHLINRCKSELGKISKIILENISKTLIEKLNVNQWKNTETVIHWFKSIE